VLGELDTYIGEENMLMVLTAIVSLTTVIKMLTDRPDVDVEDVTENIKIVRIAITAW
jgi:hypothetical protein